MQNIPTTIDVVRFFYIYQTNIWIWVTIGLVFCDIFSGLIKAWVMHSINSSIGVKGLAKHFSVILLTIVIYPTVVYLTFEEVAWMMLALVMVTYAISITENFSEIGVPMPRAVVSRLKKLKDNIDPDEDKP
ncbi:phage holin family protein [Streptococcus sp. zg-JUN1979]|uniref:phage holin family protein n=1 Tax=Streptococcus sp. zg-JUN1979 TaxID=3391450 RepID=UPI0039A76B70